MNQEISVYNVLRDAENVLLIQNVFSVIVISQKIYNNVIALDKINTLTLN
jgi:hypothetical protein